METILISGCGGGYDLYGCLPLLYELLESNDTKTIILSNLSFTNVNTLDELSQKYQNKIIKICDNCYEVNEGYYADDILYFPEYLLANQLHIPVCTIGNYDTVHQIMEFYDKLTKIKNINKIDKFYLVDGGCDVLLKGTETHLATYVEDMMHLKAIKNLIENNVVFSNCIFCVCVIGMNVDCGHGVIEDELLERLKEMEDTNIIIKKEILNLSQPKVNFYYETVLKCKPENTLVHSFVLCALENKTGYIIPEYEGTKIKKKHMCQCVQFDKNLFNL